MLDIAHAEDVDAADLQLGRRYGSGVAAGCPGDFAGRDYGLLETRPDQSGGDTVELGAFADRIDVGVAGQQAIGYANAAADDETDVAGELHVGADTGADDHRVTRNAFAAAER